jgi:hypothetical protein
MTAMARRIRNRTVASGSGAEPGAIMGDMTEDDDSGFLPDDPLTDLRGPYRPLPRNLTEPDDLPPDPDLDDLPPELAEHDGPIFMRARDRETGELSDPAPTTCEDVAISLADLRRSREDDE